MSISAITHTDREVDNHIQPGTEVVEETVVGHYDTYEEAKEACKSYIPSKWSRDCYEYVNEIDHCNQFYIFVKFLEAQATTVYIKCNGAPPLDGQRASAVYVVVEQHGATLRPVDTTAYDSLISANIAARTYLQSLSSAKATESNIMGRVLPYCGTVDVGGKQITVTVTNFGVSYSTPLPEGREVTLEEREFLPYPSTSNSIWRMISDAL